MNNQYGLEPKTMEEEMNLPKNINQTRGNKICIIDWCEHIKRMADLIADRARNTPEEDNDHHAELVDEFKTKVRKAGLMLDDAYMVGKN